MPIHPSARRLLTMMSAFARESAKEAGPVARRDGLATLAAWADARESVVSETLRIAGPAGSLPLHVFSPPTAASRAPLGSLAFFHGGGWVAGGRATHEGLCARLCLASGLRIVLVDYRLAPEHPFPAALDDCVAAVRWLAEHASAVGVEPGRLAIGGDSIGAGLAAAAARIFRDQGGPPLAMQVLICPILDPGASLGTLARADVASFVSCATFESDLRAYLGPRGSVHDPRIAPLRAARFDGLPPALIEAAEFDPFAADAEAYAAQLRGAGVDVAYRRHAGMIHYFYALARAIPSANEAAKLIGRDLAGRLGHLAPATESNVA